MAFSVDVVQHGDHRDHPGGSINAQKHFQQLRGIGSLSGETFYHQVSWNLVAAKYHFRHVWGRRQVAKRLDYFNSQTIGFEAIL